MAQTHKRLRGNKHSKRGFRKVNKTAKRKLTKRRQSMRRQRMTKKRALAGGAPRVTNIDYKIQKLMELMPDKPVKSLIRAFPPRTTTLEQIEAMTPAHLMAHYEAWRLESSSRRRELREQDRERKQTLLPAQPQQSTTNLPPQSIKRVRETFEQEPSDETMPEVHMDDDIVPYDPLNPYDPKDDLKDMQDWDVPVIQPRKKLNKSWVPPKVHSTETRPFDPYAPNDPHNDLQTHMHWDEEIPQGHEHGHEQMEATEDEVDLMNVGDDSDVKFDEIDEEEALHM